MPNGPISHSSPNILRRDEQDHKSSQLPQQARFANSDNPVWDGKIAPTHTPSQNVGQENHNDEHLPYDDTRRHPPLPPGSSYLGNGHLGYCSDDVMQLYKDTVFPPGSYSQTNHLPHAYSDGYQRVPTDYEENYRAYVNQDNRRMQRNF